MTSACVWWWRPRSAASCRGLLFSVFFYTRACSAHLSYSKLRSRRPLGPGRWRSGLTRAPLLFACFVLPRSQRWVERLNEGLRASAGGCLAAFVICDIASALALYGAIAALNVTEDSEKLIGAILLGNNVVNILSASLATAMFTRAVRERCAFLTARSERIC